jgi:hypothetical protein
MHELVINASFDGDLLTKLSHIEYSTAPQATVTIEKAMRHYDRMEMVRRMKEDLQMKRETLSKWLGIPTMHLSEVRVRAMYQKEYNKRIKAYNQVMFGGGSIREKALSKVHGRQDAIL